MRIIYHECKKAFTSPILLTLFVVFSAFNIFLIVGNTYVNDELKVANELSETYGLEITDKSLKKFEQDLQMDYAELTSITGEEFKSVYDFLDDIQNGRLRCLYGGRAFVFPTAATERNVLGPGKIHR